MLGPRRGRSAESDISEPQPNDIAATMGTLIGLLFTAFALLANATFSQVTFATLSGIEFIILVFFILTAFCATLASVTGRPVLWAAAKGLYPASWFGLAIGIGLIFLMIAQPQIATSNNFFSLIVSAVGIVIAVIAATISLRTARSFETIRTEAVRIPPSGWRRISEEVQTEVDLPVLFLKKAIQLEAFVRALGKAKNLKYDKTPVNQLAQTLYKLGVLSEKDYGLFSALWRIRNLVAHGNEVPRSDLKASLNAVTELGNRLDSLVSQSR